ncbi:MAG TPA: RiPP maturation radical SAM C-methyltransferase [Pyrinomonadaceae bacterium]|jgi:ribosomal peptide maturation radical SAM protein 1
MEKILLISMPFGALERPALGLSMLKARLAEEGFACDVRYLNFTFAEFVGADIYQWMCYELPYTAFAGDWAFTAALYGDRPDAEHAYVQEILRDTWRLSEEDIRRVLYVRSLVGTFIEHCMAAVDWQDYRIVGFTSTFEQNIASLAMAKHVKAAHPRLSIAFGGANWEDCMGLELHRQFPFVDYVCSGEAEQSFPALVRRVLDGEPMGREPIPGVVWRDARGRSISGGPPRMVREMDELPYPDFTDYFHDLQQSSASLSVVPTLLFETSRGCWWGAKQHCTFCGLNGGSMSFRSKSPRRALDELEHLVNRWQSDHVEAVDNILDMKYFDDMLPALARSGRALSLFYEVKANLSRDQVRVLAEAGVKRIQPGIESLSDHVLQLMRKGTTGLRNVQLLKWAQEYGITVEWNILYGFPGETAEDYRRVLEMLPALRFLRPPCATGPIRLDRFSPYHKDPAEFGLTNVRPLNTYRHLYPFNAESLGRIAYYFEFDYEAGVDPAGRAAEVVAYAEEWRRNPEHGTLRAVTGSDGEIVLFDTRSGASLPELKLVGLERAAYEYCDQVHARANIIAHLRRTFPDVAFDEHAVQAFLDSLVANRLMVTDGENYLSLALRPAAPTAHARRAVPQQQGTPPPVSSYLRPELKVLTA